MKNELSHLNHITWLKVADLNRLKVGENEKGEVYDKKNAQGTVTF
tara:strand:- start:773 stop:907 length:135 start_codon:yes stop_codon:yes gene_type:complete